MTSATPTFDRFISLQASGLFNSYLHTATDATYQADFKRMQAEMSAMHRSRREEIARFRVNIAELTATVRRCVQLGLVAGPRTRLLLRLHGAVTWECDVQEQVDELGERIGRAGGRLGELGPRNTKGEEGMAAMIGLFVEVSTLQTEKQKLERELERAVTKRMAVEREMEGLGCRCQAKMCARCMESLRQCKECEELGRAWKKMVRK